MPELLAPAGSLENLYWACAYGADAVYFGMQNFSLRSFAGNFDFSQAQEGLSYLHSLGKKGYAALNIYPFTHEYSELLQTASRLHEMNVDAFIAADPGVVSALLTNFPDIPVHVSTQANTVSSQTALFYKSLGASRVNLARELSFENISRILNDLKGKIETEIFVHGAVCFSYSGRCAISDYLSGRGANRGECAQSCRWKYTLCEETRPDEHLPVFEDERGLYLFNSKDLALYNYIPALIDAGADSFKIEGRMKGIHYLASVLSIYRRIIDGEKLAEEEILSMLSRVSHREYSEGFMKGSINHADYRRETGGYIYTSQIMAHSLPGKIGNMRRFAVKGSLYAGEKLEILSPGGKTDEFFMPDCIVTEDGKELMVAQNCHVILLPETLPDYSILRRICG